MTPVAFLLTLGAALAWGGFDAVRKQLALSVEPLPLAALTVLPPLPIFLAWMLATGGGLVEPGYWLEALGSVGVNLVGNILFLRAMQLSALSTSIPFLAFSPVFSALFSTLMLGEELGSRQGLGVGAVVFGAFLLNVRREDWQRPSRFIASFTRDKGALMVLACAALWTLGSIFDKRALRMATAPEHAFYQGLGMVVGLLAVLAVRRQLAGLKDVRRVWGVFIPGMALPVVGQVLQLMALPIVVVSLYEALKRCIGMVQAVVNGVLFFGESVNLAKLGSIALMGAGVLLILL